MLREILEENEFKYLASYALKSAESRGRRYPEPKHPYRTEFQRDRDRIVHSTAFRRLQYKTQVFVNHEGDHYRTRLTHTIEVELISRSIARALRLNEDFCEALALVHDLGHTPFGHSGEDALNEIMKDHGGFEHNRQCLRVVDLLESRYPEFPGLNLTYELRESILKHHSNFESPNIPDDLRSDFGPPLESQVVNLADEIAYNCHDIDDGLASGILSGDGLGQLDIWKEGIGKFRAEYPDSDSRLARHYMIRYLINYFVTDLIDQSSANIAAENPHGPDDIIENRKSLISFSAEGAAKSREVKLHLGKFLYGNSKLKNMSEKSKKMVYQLFDFYKKHPDKTGIVQLNKTEKNSSDLFIADYIAGMTDRFAASEFARLIEKTAEKDS